MGRLTSILFLLPGLSTGGSERLVVDSASALSRQKVFPRVAAMDDGALRSELEALGIPVTILTAGLATRCKPHRLWVVSRRLRYLARHADVVHSHHLNMLLHSTLAGWPRRPWAWVHTEHTEFAQELTYPVWLRFLGQCLLRAPDAVTCVAAPVAQHLVERVPSVKSRCTVITNGIDLARFASGVDRAAKRRELGLPVDAWVVGTVGSLRAQKNHALLLHAFVELRRSVPSAWLAIVGGGELLGPLQTLSRELRIDSCVSFLGSRLDVPEILRTFDAFCLSSDYEGMPLSVLEAMASGLPVVVTGVTGSRAMITPTVTGLVSPPRDPSALGHALTRLFEDRNLAARLGRRAQEHVAFTVSLPTMLTRYTDLYERLLSLRDRRRGAQFLHPPETR